MRIRFFFELRNGDKVNVPVNSTVLISGSIADCPTLYEYFTIRVGDF